MMLPSSILWFLFLFISSCASINGVSVSKKIGHGYRLVSLMQSELDGGYLVGYLKVKKPTSIYGPDIRNLRLFVKHETENRVRVHITDADNPRWEVPYNLLPRTAPPPIITKTRKINFSSNFSLPFYAGSELIFSYQPDPFAFTISRKSDNQILFDTSNFNFFFKDQYIEISTRLPETASLYGLGEHTQPDGIKLKPKVPTTLFTTDKPALNLNTDLYGSHPVYMDLRNNGGNVSTHGVLLLNSNGMDVFYNGSSLTYKIIGGLLDFYFFSGPSPLDVVDQYTALIGRPAPMPYWAFGFHQCKFGYKDISVVQGVVDGYKKAKIPLDVIWNDDDHMEAAKDFTLDPVNYPRDKLLNFLNQIHSEGMKYIVLIDPGISVNTSYGVYQRAMAKDVFIKLDGKPYLAQVWPGPVNFPDFLNPNGVSWWVDEISRFHQLVPVDGLWIDMNEASNFCWGKCTMPTTHQCPVPKSTTPWDCCLDCQNITSTRWDDPPYKINASGFSAPLGFNTIVTSAVHFDGTLEYNAHSLYGFSQTIATHKALLGIDGKRPFILSRSTFVGSGSYVAHWTGDIKSTWKDLKYSITTMLNFGIFGVPMVGADICGFFDATTEELCSRWIELGAFYPFSRDHADFGAPRQELYLWDSVAKSARNALGLRYKLLPYLYTSLYDAHKTGAPIARPLFFSFPDFAPSYNLSTQFLLGSGVLVSPVLEQNATSVAAMFPPGSWYNLFNMTKVVVSKDASLVTLDAPLSEINVHVYEGMVLPMQRGGTISKQARETPFTLVIAFPYGADVGEAKGKVYIDDDERPEMTLVDGEASYIEFEASFKEKTVKISSNVQMGDFVLEKGLIIEKMTVLGLQGKVKDLVIEVDGNTLVNTTSVSFNYIGGMQKIDEVNKKGLVVEVGGLQLPLGKSFSMSWKMDTMG
ncbi:hypothetical protein LUZ60_005804 [Juncus effusus]|nr:hypothetical protein LUZ60_005804 [Juncus effusus]